MAKKQRLDILLVERNLAPSRTKAQAMIMAAEIHVDGQLIDKPGMKVANNAKIKVKDKVPYVSRGGEKLAGALTDFNYNPAGKICADVGASTGGFTDCLLQHNAKRVYAIDVGYGQLAHRIRQDERVIVIERTNARYLESLAEPIDLVVIDASFISLRLLLPAIKNWLKPQADVIALIKPQFEAGRDKVGKGGIIRDETVHQEVLEVIEKFATKAGFMIHNLTTSPIYGAKGNKEFLMWLGWQID